jgi:hypothetical protein
MPLTLTDFGLTGFIDFSDATKGTVDASNRISAWQDSLGLLANFTQGTDANKPLLTRADNKENLVLYSEQLNDVNYTKVNVTVTDNQIANPVNGTVDVDLLVDDATSGAHELRQPVNVVSGQTYRISCYAKRNTGTTLFRLVGTANFTNVNFAIDGNGVIQLTGAGASNIQVESLGSGWFRLSMTGVATASGAAQLRLALLDSAGNASYSGSGTGWYLWGAQVQTSQADSTYLATTTAPQYRGVNGRTAARFNGAQWLATTSQLSSMFTNSAALIYAIARVNLLGSEHQMTRASAPAHFALRTKASNAFYFINDDGSADYSETPATAVVNTNYILRGRLSGGSIYAALDSGAGFSEGAGVVSGNATTMTATYAIGASAGTAIYGDILALAFANTGSAKPNLEKLLSEYYFSRSMLKFDLIKGLYLGNKNDSI